MKTFTEGVAAIRTLDRLNADIDPGMCKQRTREAFGIPSNGTKTAAASWAAARDQHRDSNPAKAPAYTFGWMTGGSDGAGHVVVNLGSGRILTPGGPLDPDSWYETTAAALLKAWGNLTWVGWTYSIDGQAPIRPATPKTPKASPGKWARFLHLANYARNDSLRGIREAHERGGAIDLNFHWSPKAQAWFNTHWSQPLLHGFVWDKTATRAMRALPRQTRIETMTARQVRHLVSKRGGYRINRAVVVLKLADQLGVRVEFEDKGGSSQRPEAYRQLANIPAVRSLQARGLFQVKTLVQIPVAANRLRAAKAAGFVTIVSTTNARSKLLSLKQYGPVADYVRGSVTWTA